MGGKEEERRGGVGKASKAALGDALDHGLAGIGLEEAGVEVGADIAGRQRIDAAPEAREFERGDLGQLDDRGLLHGVGHDAAPLPEPLDRRHIYIYSPARTSAV